MSEYNPLISVIIPVYNGEIYLRDTLHAVLNSKYKNLEILLIDDGSTDGSASICREFADIDDRVRYVYQKNAGIVAARNAGIQNAKGEYLCFCDQDDLMDDNMYLVMINKIMQDQSDVCICGTCRITNDLEKTSYELLETACYTGKEIVKGLLYPLLFAEFKKDDVNAGLTIYGTIWNVMMKRVFLEKNSIRFKRFVNFEDDWIMDIELLSYASKVSTVEQQLYYWRVNTRSESYNWRYIEDIAGKFDRLDNYIEQVFRLAGHDEKLIEDYRKAKTCLNIVKVFENEASPNNQKRIGEKVRYLKSYMKKAGIRDGIQMKESLKSGYIRYEVLLLLLKKKLVLMGYLANKFLKLMAIYGMNHKWGVKLDKGLKGKRQNGEG